jgi:hypothetical protein
MMSGETDVAQADESWQILSAVPSPSNDLRIQSSHVLDIR